MGEGAGREGRKARWQKKKRRGQEESMVGKFISVGRNFPPSAVAAALVTPSAVARRPFPQRLRILWHQGLRLSARNRLFGGVKVYDFRPNSARNRLFGRVKVYDFRSNSVRNQLFGGVKIYDFRPIIKGDFNTILDFLCFSLIFHFLNPPILPSIWIRLMNFVVF